MNENKFNKKATEHFKKLLEALENATDEQIKAIVDDIKQRQDEYKGQWDWLVDLCKRENEKSEQLLKDEEGDGYE